MPTHTSSEPAAVAVLTHPQPASRPSQTLNTEPSLSRYFSLPPATVRRAASNLPNGPTTAACTTRATTTQQVDTTSSSRRNTHTSIAIEREICAQTAHTNPKQRWKSTLSWQRIISAIWTRFTVAAATGRRLVAKLVGRAKQPLRSTHT